MGCHARAEKKITVKIAHAPSLAGALAGRLVTPGQLTGDCAKEFGDLVFQDMRAHGAAMAGGADSAAAAAPAIALSIKVSRCEARPQPAMLGEGLPAMHIARTEGWFLAQVSAVDAASGQELAAVAVRGHAQKENQSQTSAAEWPAPSELKSMAVRQGLAEAQRLYATWIESREIPFMEQGVPSQTGIRRGEGGRLRGAGEAVARQRGVVWDGIEGGDGGLVQPGRGVFTGAPV